MFAEFQKISFQSRHVEASEDKPQRQPWWSAVSPEDLYLPRVNKQPQLVLVKWHLGTVLLRLKRWYDQCLSKQKIYLGLSVSMTISSLHTDYRDTFRARENPLANITSSLENYYFHYFPSETQITLLEVAASCIQGFSKIQFQNIWHQKTIEILHTQAFHALN